MTKHRSHSAAFKRQVTEEFIAGETLHALSKQHDISRQLIHIWVGRLEAGGSDDDVQAADLMQEHEAKIAALKRMIDRQALEIELTLLHGPKSGRSPVMSPHHYGKRTYSGRPSSSMRFSASTVITISVARCRSVRDRRPSPIICLKRLMSASTRARQL